MLKRPSVRLPGLIPGICLLLLTLAIRATADEQRFTIEDVNDDEFASAPPPPPVHEVETTFEFTRSGEEHLVPIVSRNLRNLSVTLENRGRGLVRSPYLFGPHGWDFRSLEKLAAEATRGPGLSTTEKFIRIHEWKGLHVMTVLGGSYEPYNDDDFSGNPLRVLNQYGHGMCGQSINTTNALLMAVPPAGTMFGRKVKLNSHRVGEAFFEGRWHAFDTTPGTGIVQWVYYDSSNTEIAPTWKYLISRPELLAQTKAWSGFSLQSYAAGATGETIDEREKFRTWDFNHVLRPGESLTMYFDMRGRLDRTSARQDNSKSYRCYSDYASAVLTYRPDLTTSLFARYTEQQVNVKASASGLVPVDPSKPSRVVFPLRSTWCFVGSEIEAVFKTSGKVSICVNRDPFDADLPSRPLWRQLSASQREYGDSSIEGLMAYWVQCEFQGPGSGLSEISIASEMQMSRWSMPALEFGVNRVRFEAEDLDGSSLQVTYKYDDRSPFNFYEPATSRTGRHIPVRIGGVLQQGSKKESNDWRKGRFWERLKNSPDDRVPVRIEIYKVSGESGVGNRVRTLINKSLRYGLYEFYWDGKDDSGKLLAVGMYAYRVTVDGEVVHGERLYLYSEIWPRPNEVVDSQPIVIVGAATAVPSRPLLGQWARFSVEARAAPGEPIAYAWDFGDGATGAGPTVVHAYSRAGTYRVVATALDSAGNSARSEVSVQAMYAQSPTVAPWVPWARRGADGLVPLGLEPNDPGAGAAVGAGGGGGLAVLEDEAPAFAAATPVNAAAAEATTFALKSFSGNVRFDRVRGQGRRGPDRAIVAGVITGLPAGWEPEAVSVVVDVGGVESRFVLDRNGRARSELGTLRLRCPRRRGAFAGGAVAFRLELRGDLANEWVDEGVLGDFDETRAPVDLEIALTIGERRFAASAGARLDVEAGHVARLRLAERR